MKTLLMKLAPGVFATLFVIVFATQWPAKAQLNPGAERPAKSENLPHRGPPATSENLPHRGPAAESAPMAANPFIEADDDGERQTCSNGRDCNGSAHNGRARYGHGRPQTPLPSGSFYGIPAVGFYVPVRVADFYCENDGYFYQRPRPVALFPLTTQFRAKVRPHHVDSAGCYYPEDRRRW